MAGNNIDGTNGGAGTITRPKNGKLHIAIRTVLECIGLFVAILVIAVIGLIFAPFNPLFNWINKRKEQRKEEDYGIEINHTDHAEL